MDAEGFHELNVLIVDLGFVLVAAEPVVGVQVLGNTHMVVVEMSVYQAVDLAQ